MEYFSERQEGVKPREHETIGKVPWEGIDSHVRRYLANKSFGAMSDDNVFWRTLRAEVPELPEFFEFGDLPEPPPTLVVLDLIEFCWNSIEKPIRGEDHYWGKPDFVAEGQQEFRSVVNRIFRRNGLAYELGTDGRIERVLTPVLQNALATTRSYSGDDRLDQILERARQKFLDPDEGIRLEALKELWDAWERLKTLGNGRDKKEQTKSILDDTAGSHSPNFRVELEREASALTAIGNMFQIRHSETTQEPLAQSAHVDYLFHRLFALIQMIIRRQSRSGERDP